MTLDLASLRSHFPFTETWNYLNHATHGPFPTQTAATIAELASGWTSPADLDHSGNAKTVQAVKSLIAGMVNGSPDSIAFTGNLAESMSLAACGIDWQDGDNCILPAHEFPSVVYPFLNLQHRGVQVRFAPRGDDDHTSVDEIRKLVDRKTRAVIVSYVEFMDGFRNDLPALAEICRENDALLVTDVTQALGPSKIDVGALGIDVFGAHSYKWLMASYGVGVTWLSDRALERVRPTYAGRLSVKHGFEDQEFSLDWRDGAARFQTGGLNWITLAGLESSLRLLTSMSQDAIVRHTLDLNDRVLDGAQRKRYIIQSSRIPDRRSAIVAFSTGDHSRDGEIVQELERHNISVALRGRGIRVSPYFYNSVQEVEHLVEALPDLQM